MARKMSPKSHDYFVLAYCLFVLPKGKDVVIRAIYQVHHFSINLF